MVACNLEQFHHRATSLLDRACPQEEQEIAREDEFRILRNCCLQEELQMKSAQMDEPSPSTKNQCHQVVLRRHEHSHSDGHRDPARNTLPWLYIAFRIHQSASETQHPTICYRVRHRCHCQ